MTESRHYDNEEDRIDLMSIVFKMLKALKRLWIWVLLITVLCTAGYTGLKWRRYRPQYQAAATFTVSAATSNDDVSTALTTSFNTSYAETFAKTFPYIINNDVMREIIKEDLNMPYVNGTITAATTEKTNLVTITVTSSSSDDALAILESVINNYPQVARFVLGDTSVEILKKPMADTTPINQLNLPRSAVKGAVIGAFLSVLLLAFAAMMDNTISGRNDMLSKLHIRCLGVLPEMEFNRRMRKSGGSVRTAITIEDERTPSNYKEAVRSLRTHVLQALKEYPDDKVIMVTSTVPGEGKSTVAMNLALSIAHNGQKVILIDADMRRQSIRRIADPEKKHMGLADVLYGNIPWFDAVFQYGSHNLRVLTGKTDPGAAEMLDSKNMSQIIDSMRKNADYIVIDTPPGGLLADAHVISNVADCAVYVVKPNQCHAESILYALETLSNGTVHMLGGVLNGVDETSGGYGYSNYGRYGYGYGHYGYGHYGKYGYGHYGYGYGEKKENK